MVRHRRSLVCPESVPKAVQIGNLDRFRPKLATYIVVLLSARHALTLSLAVTVHAQQSDGIRSTANPTGSAVEEHLGLQYSESSRSPRRNSLDLYLPTQVENPPLVMFVHGGTWVAGSSEQHSFVGKTLAMAGMAGAVINYRLFPFARWPNFAEDGAAALAWLLDNADRFGFDANRVFLMGHSAGGHIAAAVSYDARWLEAHGYSPDLISGFIGLSGVYDLRPRDNRLSRIFGKTAKLRTDASPMVFAEQNAPPALLFFAENDIQRLDASARVFANRLQSLGIRAEAHELRGESHTSYVRRIGKGRRDVISDRIRKFIGSQESNRDADGALRQHWGVTVELDRHYAEGGDDAQTLDLYRPDRDEPAPLLVLVHGGDWTGGDKADLAGLARLCARQGLAVASVNHRLAPAHGHPAALQDVALACRWLHAHAADLGVEDANIHLGGIGSGGQLALVVSLDRHWLDAIDAPPDIIATTAAISAPCDVRLDEPLFKGVFGDDPEVRELASPIELLDRRGPEVLLIWSDSDPDYVISSNSKMPSQLKQKNLILEFTGMSGTEMLADKQKCGELVAMLTGFFVK